MFSVNGSPGRTTPVAGETVSQVAPDADAVKVMGAPAVVSAAVARSGGAVTGFVGKARFIVVGLMVIVGKGAVMLRVTTMFRFAMPGAVTVTVAWLWPSGRLVGLTRMLRLAGSFP